MTQNKIHYTISRLAFLGVFISGGVFYAPELFAEAQESEFIEACIMDTRKPSMREAREHVAACLGWHARETHSFCPGRYDPLPIEPLGTADTIQLKADEASFDQESPSHLMGHVQVKQNDRMITARTATIYRNSATQKIERIELDSNVHFMEPGRLLIAQHANLNTNDQSGDLQQVMYRFDTTRATAFLPAWGTADWIKRFANQDYQFHQATYSTCPPNAVTWQIQAKDIRLDHANQTGVARNAFLRLGKMPILYTPYLSFATNSKRKSGFLMPLAGYSNVSGFDFALPYYLNLAPNYDATFIPHYYTFRGWMLGGNARFLTESSTGAFGGAVVPQDKAYQSFLQQNEVQFPKLQGNFADRWSVFVRENTQFLPNLNLNIDFQQVSDDYYLQDFNTNLAISSENQLLRRGSLVYTNDHWMVAGMLQSYQTLHPINQSAVADVYDRLPQLLAQGEYQNLPLNGDLKILGQYDYFHWTGQYPLPQGSRYHAQPTLSFPYMKPWGYVTPSVELVENNYALFGPQPTESFNRLIPRFYVDSGLIFERDTQLFSYPMTQTLEPRLFYLNVPYENQSEFPAFDSAYMIFNADQLFRTNRFSGFDRISDANQLAYAATSRWLSSRTGSEKAVVTVGQIRYFAQRKVQLCYQPDGQCQDPSVFLGYVSPTDSWSPIASRATYNFNKFWSAVADYVWDPATHATNNANLNLHYQSSPNRILNLGYNYLTDGNVFFEPGPNIVSGSMNQIIGSYAWPMNENWSSLGIYSYNISTQYSMLAFLGIQYDSCCWAARLIGGKTFKSLTPGSILPEYNNNIYFQIILKGLGSVANSSPESTIQTYLPGYPNLFH